MSRGIPALISIKGDHSYLTLTYAVISKKRLYETEEVFTAPGATADRKLNVHPEKQLNKIVYILTCKLLSSTGNCLFTKNLSNIFQNIANNDARLNKDRPFSSFPGFEYIIIFILTENSPVVISSYKNLSNIIY